MQNSLAEQIIERIPQIATLYYRLALVVAPAGSGKTAALQEVATQTGTQVINLSLELSKALLDLTERQRPLRVSRILDQIADTLGDQTLFFDHTELLFDPSLKLDPLRSLQQLARRRTVVAAWNGSLDGNYLVYARPDHPEYRRYPTADLVMVVPRSAV